MHSLRFPDMLMLLIQLRMCLRNWPTRYVCFFIENNAFSHVLSDSLLHIMKPLIRHSNVTGWHKSGMYS